MILKVKSIKQYEQLKNKMLGRFINELKTFPALILSFTNLDAMDSDTVAFDITALINHKSIFSVHIERKGNEYLIKAVD
jgi:hypothetical protein